MTDGRFAALITGSLAITMLVIGYLAAEITRPTSWECRMTIKDKYGVTHEFVRLCI